MRKNSKTKGQPTSKDLEEFKKLFRQARKEHSKKGKLASAENPAHQAAIAFAQSKQIPGAEDLLAALPMAWNEIDNEEALRRLEFAEKTLHSSLLGHAYDIKGIVCAKLKRFDEAIELFIKALDSPGYDTPGIALRSIGLSYANQQDYDRAIEYYQKALDSKGYDTPGMALKSMGSAYAKKQDYDRAIEFFQKAIETPGYDTPGMALNSMGGAYAKKQDYDRAIECYQKALDTPGYDTPGMSLNSMGIAYATKLDYNRAIEFFQRAFEAPSYDTPMKALNNLANGLRLLGRFDEALEKVNQVLSEPDTEGEHERARLIKRLIEEAKAGLAPSVAEEALSKVSSSPSDEQHEQRMLKKIADKDQYEKYLVREVPARQDCFTCLRGWSSAVTLLEGGQDCHWSGGGYFLSWQGKGIVIDPGFDFLDNFHDAGLHLKEVDAVLVSHNHSDHNYDLSSLDDLRYELHRRWKMLSDQDKKKHDVSRCLFVIDCDTAETFRKENTEHRGLPMPLAESDAQRERWISRENDLPLTIEHFKVKHGKEVPNAMGMRLRLHDHPQGKDFIFGYTGDTRWLRSLEKELAGCDVLLAHISMPDEEELLEDADYEAKKGKPKDEGGFQKLTSEGFKAVHLGYRGMIELISCTKPKMVLVGEFWAGLADLRVDLVKGLRAQVMKRTGIDIPILPTGLGFRLRLPSLEIECTSCSKTVPHTALKIAPAASPFGPLSYLCPGCLA